MERMTGYVLSVSKMVLGRKKKFLGLIYQIQERPSEMLLVQAGKPSVITWLQIIVQQGGKKVIKNKTIHSCLVCLS